MVTLEELLESRDRRTEHQKKLLQAFPGCALLCLTVQLPGPVKRNESSLVIGGAGLAALLDKLGSTLRHIQVRDLKTGYEAYLLVPLPPPVLKKIACEVEASHPLGRLMDIDVMGEDGIPLGREALGMEPRRCLLCGREVRYCMRARTHSREELLAKIDEMIKDYTK